MSNQESALKLATKLDHGDFPEELEPQYVAWLLRQLAAVPPGPALKVWTNNSFPGHWPVGTAAVVVADSAEHAAALLNRELEARGLGAVATAEQFERLQTTLPVTRILADGDY